MTNGGVQLPSRSASLTREPSTAPGSKLEVKKPLGMVFMVLSSVCGNVLEFYDFSLFAYFTAEISRTFLPGDDPVIKLIETFGIFASGFLMRPVGSVILGSLGDAKGTAWSLRLSMALMALPTVLLGCLPSYNRVGLFAPIALALLRMLQGFTAGGELIGAILYTTEWTPVSRRGFYSGLILGSGGFGILLGCLVATLVQHLCPEESLRWAWRVPFLCGIFVAVVGITMRSNTQHSHTPAAQQATATELAERKLSTPRSVGARAQATQEEGGAPTGAVGVGGDVEARRPSMLDAVKSAWRLHKLQCLIFTMLCAASQVCFYMNYVFVATYMSRLAPVPLLPKEALAVTAFGLALYTLAAPTIGFIADRVGERRVMLVSSSLLVVLPPLVFETCFASGSQRLAVLGLALLTLPMAGLQGAQMSWMIRSTTPSTRYTVIAVSFNLAAAFLAGTAPMVGTTIVRKAPDVHSGPGLYMSASACVTLLTVLVVAPLLPAILAPPLVHKAGQGGEGVATPVAVVAAPTA